MRALADRLAKKAAKSLHDATAEATGARQTEDSRRIWRRFATLTARHRRVLLALGREVQ
jgi:FixJ family two-component response regulator